MAKKIDPLNKKQYGTVSAMLTVSDITAAVAFYQKAFGRKTPPWANELPRALAPRLRVCISTWKTLDKVVAKAVGLGATAQGRVMDMFWGDFLALACNASH
jgi:uncharacterized glyoxalase superfamily protein PhnB